MLERMRYTGVLVTVVTSGGTEPDPAPVVTNTPTQTASKIKSAPTTVYKPVTVATATLIPAPTPTEVVATLTPIPTATSVPHTISDFHTMIGRGH